MPAENRPEGAGPYPFLARYHRLHPDLQQDRGSQARRDHHRHSHVGVQPTVQWKNQQVPIPMLGVASQATNETFGKDTNDASDGVLYQGVAGPDVAVTPKSIPFAEGFKKKYGNY